MWFVLGFACRCLKVHRTTVERIFGAVCKHPIPWMPAMVWLWLQLGFTFMGSLGLLQRGWGWHPEWDSESAQTSVCVQIQFDRTDPDRRINHPGACTASPQIDMLKGTRKKAPCSLGKSSTHFTLHISFSLWIFYCNLSYSLVSKALGSCAVPLHGSFMPFGVWMWQTLLPTLCSLWWGVSTVQVHTEYTLSAAELLQKAFSWR